MLLAPVRSCFVAAILVAGALPAVAQCDPRSPPRTVTLAPGDRIGAGTWGYSASPLKDHEVILTFDDGPDPAVTPAILDLLKANCLPATFFPLGERAREHPGLVKRALREGHAVGSHTFDHASLPDLPLSDAEADIRHGIDTLLADGAHPTLFRFPQLAGSDELLAWLGAQGVAVVSVDIDPWDWQGGPPAETLKRIIDGLQKEGRGIILLHDVQPNTLKLLPDLIAFLRREGYRVVRLQGPRAEARPDGKG